MILTLAERSESVSKPTYGRRRVCSEPCLPERLPTTSTCHLIIFTNFHTIFFAGVILREAEHLAPQELTRQLLKQSIEDGLADEVISNDEYQHFAQKESSPPSPSSIRSFVKSFVSPLIGQKSSTNWANVQVNTHLLN